MRICEMMLTVADETSIGFLLMHLAGIVLSQIALYGVHIEFSAIKNEV